MSTEETYLYAVKNVRMLIAQTLLLHHTEGLSTRLIASPLVFGLRLIEAEVMFSSNAQKQKSYYLFKREGESHGT